MKVYDFGSLLQKYRNKFGFTLKELGNIVEISPQYLNSIENNSGKMPKTEKLRRIFVALSLKQKTNKSVLPETKGVPQFPEAAELDLNRLKQLVFTATGLSVYENSYEPLEVLTNSKLVVKEYMQQKNFDQLPIEELRHSFQIWALNDKPGESLFTDSAYKTAYNILRYRVNYINFLPLSDDFQWKVAFRNIAREIENILSETDVIIKPHPETEEGEGDKECSEPEEIKIDKHYWKTKDDWKSYLRFYGLSEIAFLIRFRIYDCLSSTPAGNFNIGGTQKEDIRFVGIMPDNLLAMRNKLQLIITAHQAGHMNGNEPFFIPNLGCYAIVRDTSTVKL